MRAALLDFQYQLETLECASCCMTFAIPGRFIRDRRDDHKSFYCPNGHTNYYSGPSEAEKLKRLLEQKERDLVWYRSRAENLQQGKEHVENQLRATKGAVTKARKKLARVDNGVCPECHRTVKQLARHMEDKHNVQHNKPPKGSKVRGE